MGRSEALDGERGVDDDVRGRRSDALLELSIEFAFALVVLGLREILRSEVNIELNFPPKLRGARSRLYRRRFLQVNTRWKALAEIYTMHSFAPFWNRIPKNEENHGGEKILVQSREKWPGEAHRQLQLSTQCYPRARTIIKAV